MDQPTSETLPHYALIELDFGDGRYPFKLGMQEAASLEADMEKGIFQTLNEIKTGAWRLKDLREIIRWGLIGGGMSPTEAVKKVQTYVDQRPADENCALAMVIVGAALFGSPEYQQRQVAAA